MDIKEVEFNFLNGNTEDDESKDEQPHQRNYNEDGYKVIADYLGSKFVILRKYEDWAYDERGSRVCFGACFMDKRVYADIFDYEIKEADIRRRRQLVEGHGFSYVVCRLDEMLTNEKIENCLIKEGKL